MYRHLAITAIAAGLGSGLVLATASAADLGPAPAPVYTKAPVVVPFSWTGFYVGGSAGGVWGDVSNTWTSLGDGFASFPQAFPSVQALTEQSFHPASAIWGAQVGYNYQFGPMFVAGLEADISGLNLSSSRTSSLTGISGFATGAFTTETAKSHYLATVRGRLGLPINSWLLYTTGGLAVGHVDYTDFLNYNTAGATQFAESSNTRTGWTAGGGVEYALMRNWSIKAEYLYVDLGSRSAISSLVPLGFSNAFDILHQHSLTEQIGRVGVNYRLY